MVAAFGSMFCGDSDPQPSQPSVLFNEEVGNELLLIRKVGANKPLFYLLSNILIAFKFAVISSFPRP